MKSYLKQILVLMLIVSLALPLGAGAADETVTRISGSDRYATAVEVSQAGWSSSTVVVIARGDDYADALAGVPLAYRLGTPILLVAPGSLPAVTRQEILRLGASKAIILGGTGAVGSAVESSLLGMGLNVERIAGVNRYDTAARIAQRVAVSGTDCVVVASGRNFPDALSAAPYAAVAGYPVLLVESGSIPSATASALDDLGITEAIVVGGTGVISSRVLNQLPGAYRISGSDRYATSVALAQHFNPQAQACYVATGAAFADAITGAALAAKEGTGILLVGTSLPASVRDYLDDSTIAQVTILGGTGAVSTTLASAIGNILAPPAETGVSGWTTPGATVTVSGRTAVAEDSGKFQISGIPAGKYSAVFHLEGFGTRTLPVSVIAGRCSVLNADLAALNPADIYLRGIVLDKASGIAMTGVEVLVEKYSSGIWLETAVLHTDGSGIYSLTNTAGDLYFGDRVRLTIRKDADSSFQGGYHPVVLTLDLRQDAVANVVNGVEMIRVKDMNITGRVTQPGGSAVSGETVTLHWGNRAITALTNAQGDYIFQNIALPSGKYSLEVDYPGAAGYAIYSKEITVSEDRDLVHNIGLVQGYNVDVQVKAETDGATFKAGADYDVLLLQGTASIPADSVTLSADGQILAFAWDRIAPGSYSLKISGDYVLTKTFSIAVSSADYFLGTQRVTRAGTVKGIVRSDAAGTPTLAGVRVELVNTSNQVVSSVLTGSDGRYSFGSLAGGAKYTVRASSAGYRTRVSAQLVVAVNEDKVQDFALPVLPPTADVSGYVRTVTTLMPASGAVITYRALSVAGYDTGDVLKTCTVNADGSYAVDLIPGAYTVVISDPGKHETLEATLTVAAGDEKLVSYKVQIGGNAQLTVTVRDSLNLAVSPVSITDKWGDTVTKATTGGTAVFTNLSAGRYTVGADGGTAHEDLAVAVDIAAGAKVARSFTLVSSTKVYDVDFWVVGVSNTSLSGARVFVTSGSAEVDRGITNASGVLTLRLPTGSYTAKVYADGYYLGAVDFTVASIDLVVPVIRLEKW